MNINRKIIPDLDPDNGIDITNDIREKYKVKINGKFSF